MSLPGWTRRNAEQPADLAHTNINDVTGAAAREGKKEKTHTPRPGDLEAEGGEGTRHTHPWRSAGDFLTGLCLCAWCPCTRLCQPSVPQSLIARAPPSAPYLGDGGVQRCSLGAGQEIEASCFTELPGRKGPEGNDKCVLDSPVGRGEREEAEQEDGGEGRIFLWGHSVSLGCSVLFAECPLQCFRGAGAAGRQWGTRIGTWKVLIPKPGGLLAAESAKFQQHTFTGEIRKKG